MEFEVAWSPLLREERLVNWSRGERVIRRQPPVRVRYCTPPIPGACSDCEASPTVCPACRFTYCAKDFPGHVRAFIAPPDAWTTTFRKMVYRWQDVVGKVPFLIPAKRREPIERLAVGAVVLSRSPPVRVEYCKPPISSQVDLPCVHRAASCKPGEPVKCRGCGFTYCPYHLVRHVWRFAWPRGKWQKIVEDYRKQKDRAAEDARKVVWVDVEPLEVVE